MKFFLNILIAAYFLLPLSSAWSMKECPGSPVYYNDIYWTNCIGTYTWSSGDKYVGGWKDNKHHGQGTKTWSSGDKYVGGWVTNKKHGQGTYTWPKGDKYVGEYKDDKKHGQGTYTWSSGDKYVGEYKDENFHGQGTYTFADGNKYVGEFKNGYRNGQGTFNWADGKVWDGQWKDDEWVRGKKYAKGEYRGSEVASNICPGSPIYDNDIYWTNCIGTYTFADGNKYVGEWEDNKLHGQGTYTFADGDKYVGEFKDDKRNGQGTYYYTSDNQWKGDKYVGEFKNDNFHGQGTYTFARGDKYVGEFKDDKSNGQGTYFFADGRVWIGKWKNWKWQSGKKYAKGEYKGSVVADNKNNQNEQTQKALEQERRKAANERTRREKLEKELAKLKAQEKEKKQRIESDINPPQIVINSTNVQDKQGIIKGKVSDNIEVAELTIDGRRVSISNSGSFTHNLFVPQDGIKVSIEATDNSGLTTKEILIFERNETLQNNVLSFAKLNPINIKGKKNKHSIALIIGISKYNNAPEAKYADRDANYFSDFAENVLGINKSNIKLISNNSASNTALKKALKIWLKGYSTPNQSDIYIFFAGHGLASTNGQELYLLPYDGEPRLLEDTALLRSEIFDTVKSINPKSVTVFLDACYSGQTREKDMILADARPISIVPIESDVPENFTVFSASSGSEISGSLPEADHGLFSYFLMKGLEGDADANNDNKITNGELHNYVRSNVTRQAVRLGREQTPQLQGDEKRVLVEFN